MRYILRLALGLFAAALVTPALAQQATATPRAPVTQPSLKQSTAPQSRSAQGDCVREANRRGFVVLETYNFQQSKDGWSIDLRVRDQRGRLSNGSCFVETRTGEVNLYGVGWGYADDGDDRMLFNCASVDFKYRECQLPIAGRVVLAKRLSDARCVEGRSWGQRGDRVWVDQGCRAKFEVQRSGAGAAANTLDCNSDGDRYRECLIGPGYFGQLLRDNSNGRCRKDSTWGTRDGVIWVTVGCRGRFEKVRGNASSSVGAAEAVRACANEVQRRGGRILQQDAAVPMPGGYRMQLRVRMPSGETRSVGCTYSTQSRQARVEVLSGA